MRPETYLNRRLTLHRSHRIEEDAAPGNERRKVRRLVSNGCRARNEYSIDLKHDRCHGGVS